MHHRCISVSQNAHLYKSESQRKYVSYHRQYFAAQRILHCGTERVLFEFLTANLLLKFQFVFLADSMHEENKGLYKSSYTDLLWRHFEELRCLSQEHVAVSHQTHLVVPGQTTY